MKPIVEGAEMTMWTVLSTRARSTVGMVAVSEEKNRGKNSPDATPVPPMASAQVHVGSGNRSTHDAAARPNSDITAVRPRDRRALDEISPPITDPAPYAPNRKPATEAPPRCNARTGTVATIAAQDREMTPT